MKKFFKIMIDEFKNFLSDKGVILIMVFGITAYLFCYALPYYKEVIKEAPIGIVDLDRSNLSKTFIRNLDTTDSVKIVTTHFSNVEAEKSFYEGKIKAFVIIPKDFEKDILKGKQANILFYGDSAYLIIYKTMYASVVQTSMNFGAQIEVGKMMKAGTPKRFALVLKQPFEFVTMPLYNAVGGYKSYVYPMILILILHQTFILGLGLLQGTRNEKKEKYCENIEDIPITLFARSSAYMVLYMFYANIVFLIFPAIFVFPMSYNIIPLFLMYILMMYAAAFFLQTLCYWIKTRETIIMIMVPLSIVFLFIAGIIWPREVIPDFINLFSFFIPATCGMDGIVKINLNGASFKNVIYDYLWLLFLCIFYFCTAIYLTRKSDIEKERSCN